MRRVKIEGRKEGEEMKVKIGLRTQGTGRGRGGTGIGGMVIGMVRGKGTGIEIGIGEMRDWWMMSVGQLITRREGRVHHSQLER